LRILCLIPVRGGSKGLPRKNALEIYKGKSLLEWTIIQANKAFPHEDIIVSTEDNELSNIAKSVNAIVLDRPANLAQDDTTTAAVVENILQHLDPDKKIYDAICILQVTSALRKNEDILESIKMISSKKYDSVISCFKLNNIHPAKQYTINKVEGVPVAESILTESHPLQQKHANRHQRSKIYQRNGAIFLVTQDHFTKTGLMWGGCIGIVEMPFERSIDIDTKDELDQARQYLEQNL
jgi:CMP-N,N'-diacetyllegionaminic acid synthase